MKSKTFLTVIAIAILVVPSYLYAAPVLDEAGTIKQDEGFKTDVFPFTANMVPLTYVATLDDLSFILEKISPETDAGFILLSLTVASREGDILGSIDEPGSFPFKVDAGERYLAIVQGATGDDFDIGMYGVTIESVPIPATLLLLGSGLLGLLALKRRR